MAATDRGVLVSDGRRTLRSSFIAGTCDGMRRPRAFPVPAVPGGAPEATQAFTVLSGLLRSGTRGSALTAAGTIAGDGPDPAFIEVPARERQQPSA